MVSSAGTQNGLRQSPTLGRGLLRPHGYSEQCCGCRRSGCLASCLPRQGRGSLGFQHHCLKRVSHYGQSYTHRNVPFKISPFPGKFLPTVWKQLVAWLVFPVTLWWRWIKAEEAELMKFDDVKFASVLHLPPALEIPASFRPGQPHKKTWWVFFFLFPIFCMSVQELYPTVHNQLASQLIPVTRMVKDCACLGVSSVEVQIGYLWSAIHRFSFLFWDLMFSRPLALDQIWLKLSNVVPRY